MSNKRVLFLMPNWKAYSEPWMLSMMEALGENLIAICVLAETEQKHWGKVPVFSINKLRFSLLNHVKARLFGKHYYSDNGILTTILKRERIDIVLGHYGTFVSGFEETWKKMPVKLLVHMHGFDAHTDLRDVTTGKMIHHDDYVDKLRRISQKATIIANSYYTQSLLEKDFGIKKERIVVKYLGVPHQAFTKVHVKKEKVSIVFIGRLIDFKAPHLTIQAFESACEMGLSGTLTLIGDGHLRKTCEQARENSAFKDRIFILGPLANEQALSYLKEADIFTQHNTVGELSGQTECLGISILEAMNYGIPVVVTRSGGVEETVEEGVTGYKITPGDVQAQAKALLRLASDEALRNEMGNNGKKRVEGMFSQEKEKRELNSLIHNAIENV